jgi:hypothetical protein
MSTNEVLPYGRYRITLLHDVVTTDDAAIERGEVEWFEDSQGGARRFKVPKMVIPAGTVYEGVASDVDQDGFFDLNLDTGETIDFRTGDEGIQIEEVPQ